MCIMKKCKRLISLAIALCLIIGSCPCAFAINTDIDDLSGTESPPITENVAFVLAAMFVAGNTDCTVWDDRTQFDSITPLYDEDDSIEAYCLSLVNEDNPNGYIVVSANFDNPLIIEFSDEAALYASNASVTEEPVEINAVSSERERIYYYGPLDYSTEKRTIEFDAKAADSAESVRSADTTNSMALVNAISNTLSSIPNVATTDDGLPIVNPISYIQQYFPGWTYSNYDYNNLDPNYQRIEQYRISHTNACVSYATAAVIHYWRPSWAYTDIVSQCLSTHSEMWPNATDYTVPLGSTSSFVRNVLDSYSLTHWNTGSVYFNTWENGKEQIDLGNPFIMCLATGGGYQAHAVTVFAWTIFEVSNGDLTGYQNFFKIQDGYTTSSRYICTSTLEDVTDFLVYIS